MEIQYPKNQVYDFVISKSSSYPGQKAEYSRIELTLGDYSLFTSIKYKTLKCADGEIFGYVVGDYFHTYPENDGDILLPLEAGALFGEDKSALEQAIEECVYTDTSGSYIFILDFNNLTRCYLDACGSVPLVYRDDKLGISCATAAILSEKEFKSSFRYAEYDRLNIEDDGWFPGGLTAHEGVSRLMANHYLDMADFETRRHWPSEEYFTYDTEETSIKTIRDELGKNIQCHLQTGRCVFSITGGNETRLLLSYCKNNLDEVAFINFYVGEDDIDKQIVGKLTKAFQLPAVSKRFAIANSDQADHWQAVNGYNVGGQNKQFHVSELLLQDRDYFVSGLGGEIGRGFFWRKDETCDTEIGVQRIENALALPKSALVTEAIEKWLAKTNFKNGLLLLDLAYLELRMSCWAFSQYNGILFSGRHAHPIISRNIFDAFYRMQPQLRKNNGFIVQIIERNWPELLSIPINSLGLRDTIKRNILKVLKKPTLVIRYITRRFK